MKESCVSYLRCVRCQAKLDLQILVLKKEVKEGFLNCTNCDLVFPIIDGIPILWNDFSSYLSRRAELGGQLYHDCSQKMKPFVKKSLPKKRQQSRYAIEKRWAKIYQNSSKSKFYYQIKNSLEKIPKSKLVLEHGCSIGIISSHLAEKNDLVFGIDRSFAAISLAQKTKKQNLHYLVADSLEHPFGKQKFGLVLALNILEVVEPSTMIDVISSQIRNGYAVISDPYDFERGIYSIKKPVDAQSLRVLFSKKGFKITRETKKPSFIPWNLNLNSRCKLNYKVDLLIGKK